MSRVVIISGKQGSGKTDLIKKIAKIFELNLHAMSVDELKKTSSKFREDLDLIVLPDLYSYQDFLEASKVKLKKPKLAIVIESQRKFKDFDKNSKGFKEKFNLIEL